MLKPYSTLVSFLLLGTITARAGVPTDKKAERFWPQWRGPLATGVAPKANPPVEFGEDRNVKWKADLPGRGKASPVVWGDRVYLLTAIPTDKVVEGGDERAGDDPPPRRARGSRERSDAPSQDPPRRRNRGGFGRGGGQPTHAHQFAVLAIDRASGQTVWSKTVCEEVPHEAGHADATHASPSPIVDGQRIYAHFGSRGLYCLDTKGKVLWHAKFGQMQTAMGFGEGSSPALFRDTLVVNWDHEGDSFIVALDARTGKQRWKKPRDERTSWSTPLVLEVQGKPQVVVSATNYVRAYDLKTGAEIWKCSGMTRNTIPTPVANDDFVYAISGFRGAALLAIAYNTAKSDVSDSGTVGWTYDRATPYVPSPLLYDDALYFFDNNRAVLTCLDARTGREYFARQRIDGMDGVYASPVGAAGRVYIAGRNGRVVVLKKGGAYEVLSENDFSDGFDASPAIAGDELFLRGHKALYCIAK